jgi:hypothetical protein
MTTCPFGDTYPSESFSPFGGDGWTFTFDNGYGASVVRHPYSYGYPNLWELAVTHSGKLCYNTPITSDVLGHLTEQEVCFYLDEINALQSSEKTNV